MSKRRTHASSPRTKQVLIRLTPDEYLRRSVDARKAGLSVSGLCEQLVCHGRIEVAPGPAPLDPTLYAQLCRIGNNVNQIAHALNGNLPPDVMHAYRQARDLLHLLGQLHHAQQQERHPHQPSQAFVQQLAQALSQGNPSNDSTPPQARHVFQRSVQVHPARRGQGHE